MKSSTDLLLAFYAILGIALSFQAFMMAWLARGPRQVVTQYGDEVYITVGIFGILFVSGIILFLFWVEEYVDEALSQRGRFT